MTEQSQFNIDERFNKIENQVRLVFQKMDAMEKKLSPEFQAKALEKVIHLAMMLETFTGRLADVSRSAQSEIVKLTGKIAPHEEDFSG